MYVRKLTNLQDRFRKATTANNDKDFRNSFQGAPPRKCKQTIRWSDNVDLIMAYTSLNEPPW
jgi:hypothetical protein